MIQSIKHSMRATMLFVVVFACALVFAAMMSVQTAYAAFSFSSSSDVVGVGNLQSSATITQVSESNVSSKLDVSAVKTIASTEMLAAPSERVVKEEPIVLPKSKALSAEEMANRGLDTKQGDWFSGRSTVYDDGTRDPNGLTCAVDMSMKHLKGSFVEINYGGYTITVLVNDVGYLARSNYVFDFTPGLCHAFGYTPGDNPYVSYRFVQNIED